MVEWYYGTQGEQQGPVDDQTIRHLIASGQITDTTLVWREGMVNWSPKAEILELCSPLATTLTQAYHPSMVPSAQTSGLAIASLVCGICSILTCLIYLSGVMAVPAVICGHMAMHRISRSPEPLAGRGMAIAGLVLGYLGLLCQIATIIGGIFLFRSINSSL